MTVTATGQFLDEPAVTAKSLAVAWPVATDAHRSHRIEPFGAYRFAPLDDGRVDLVPLAPKETVAT